MLSPGSRWRVCCSLDRACVQAGPGVWTAKVGDLWPLLRRLPYPLAVNEALLLLVLVAASQQASGQVWRGLTGEGVRT